MRSFAIWYKCKKEVESEEPKKKVKADIHINLWESKICAEDNSMVYIDFGLMIDDVEPIEEIYIYCPFYVAASNVEDLGHRIIENPVLVGAIFNDNYQAKSGIPRRLIITCSNKSPFTIYEFDIKNDIDIKEIKQDGHGSLLTFSLKDILDGKYGGAGEEPPKKYYFRIRVSSKIDAMKLMFQEAKNISPFQDAFLITQVVDFRLNNLRSCNQLIRDKFAKGSHFGISQIHYLLLRKATDVFIHQGESASSRLLEKPLWEKYIDNLSESVIAYHFKKKAEGRDACIEDFCVLSRFEYQQINIKRLAAYTYVIVFLGVVAGVIANYVPRCPYALVIAAVGTVWFLLIIWVLKRK